MTHISKNAIIWHYYQEKEGVFTMWAVVEISKKQFIVNKGDSVTAPLQEQKEGNITFDNVLLLVDGDDVTVGKPYISGAKVRIYKFKRRKKYRKTQGHRQKYTILKISDIVK